MIYATEQTAPSPSAHARREADYRRGCAAAVKNLPPIDRPHGLAGLPMVVCVEYACLRIRHGMCSVCDTPELWRGAAGLCARVRACAGAAESLHVHIQSNTHVKNRFPLARALTKKKGGHGHGALCAIQYLGVAGEPGGSRRRKCVRDALTGPGSVSTNALRSIYIQSTTQSNKTHIFVGPGSRALTGPGSVSTNALHSTGGRTGPRAERPRTSRTSSAPACDLWWRRNTSRRRVA